VHSSKPSGSFHSHGDDDALISGLQTGDERAFNEVVEKWSGMMLRLALTHVESRAIAEEVVQDASLAVLRSLDRFERRSSLRTWVLGIVVNCARSRARRERRAVTRLSESAPVVEPVRFLPPDHPRWPHHWAVEPAQWRTPEAELLAGETRTVMREAIDALPPAQREVLVLRDVEGLPSGEVFMAHFPADGDGKGDAGGSLQRDATTQRRRLAASGPGG
jgi:RNA polymerase sigma-70 factor (ECF subfamily)